MRTSLSRSLAAPVVLAVLVGCTARSDTTSRPSSSRPQSEQAAQCARSDFLAEAGKTPRATLEAYYYYKDRGNRAALRPLLTKDALSMLPKEEGGGMSPRAQQLREIAVDHEQITPHEATLYYRTWFSRATKAKGGRPAVARLVEEDGQWKIDVRGSLQRTLSVQKGKDNLGFYDGTQEWWR